MKYMMFARVFMLFCGPAQQEITSHKVPGASYALHLFQDARVQVLVHVLVSQGILSRFLCRVYRGVEMLQLRTEAHTDLKRVCHCFGPRSLWQGLAVVLRCRDVNAFQRLTVNGLC